MQFLAAKSRWTMFRFARYSMQWAAPNENDWSQYSEHVCKEIMKSQSKKTYNILHSDINKLTSLFCLRNCLRSIFMRGRMIQGLSSWTVTPSSFITFGCLNFLITTTSPRKSCTMAGSKSTSTETGTIFSAWHSSHEFFVFLTTSRNDKTADTCAFYGFIESGTILVTIQQAKNTQHHIWTQEKHKN